MYEIFKGKNDQFYWRLKARNGEVIAVSEGYTTKAKAIQGIQSLQENAASIVKDLTE